MTKCLETWTESVSFQASAAVGLEYAFTPALRNSESYPYYEGRTVAIEPMGPLAPCCRQLSF